MHSHNLDSQVKEILGHDDLIAGKDYRLHPFTSNDNNPGWKIAGIVNGKLGQRFLVLIPEDVNHPF